MRVPSFCSVVDKVPAFDDQVKLFADHGVIVAPHGAGLMDLMFSRPFSAVVEVFPYQTHHNLYPGIAHMMGIAHYPVHTYNGSSVLSIEEVKFDVDIVVSIDVCLELWAACLMLCWSSRCLHQFLPVCVSLDQLEACSFPWLVVSPCGDGSSLYLHQIASCCVLTELSPCVALLFYQ